MTAKAVLSECARRGIELMADGEVLRYAPIEHVDDDLLSAMREHKIELLRELRRDAAAVDAWERLREAFDRCGRPDGWLTSDVRAAEAYVELAWLSAREDAADDRLFHNQLARWERLATVAIAAAAEGSGR